MIKRVLMVATVPSMIGQFNMNNIRILQELGYIVDVACNFSDTSVWPKERVLELKERLNAMGIDCIQLDFSRSPHNVIKHYTSFKEILKLLNERRYSFIHTHTPIASAIVRLAANKAKTKVIYTAHGFHFYDGAPLKNWIVFYPVEKWLSRYTDTLITINEEDYTRAKKKFHTPNIIKIPGVGINTAYYDVCKVDKASKRLELGVNDSDFLILSVCESPDDRNLRCVIEALHKMKNENTLGNIIYLAAGLNDTKDIEQIIFEYDLQDHIRLSGSLTDVDELCEIADCFVQPFINNNCKAIFEAMAAGLPLVSAPISGLIKTLENDVLAYCINPSNSDDMVDAILKMRCDEDYRRSFALKSVNTARVIDIKDTEQFNSDIYNENSGYRHLRRILIRQQKRNELGIGISDFVLISVGELNNNKNHQLIIKAIRNLPNVKYVIAGRGLMQEELIDLAKRLGVDDRVFILGYRTDIRDLLWMSDCFAFPSKREGLGLAAIEGLCAGLPIVASKVGGICDYTSSETGYLCKDHSVEEYSHAISSIMKDISRIDYNLNCREKSKEFDISISNGIMLSTYRKMLNEKG